MGPSPLGISVWWWKWTGQREKGPCPTYCNWLMELLGVDLEWLNTKMSTVFIGFDLRLLPKSWSRLFNSGKKTHRKTSAVIYPYNFCLLDFLEKSKSRGRGHIYKSCVYFCSLVFVFLFSCLQELHCITFMHFILGVFLIQLKKKKKKKRKEKEAHCVLAQFSLFLKTRLVNLFSHDMSLVLCLELMSLFIALN